MRGIFILIEIAIFLLIVTVWVYILRRIFDNKKKIKKHNNKKI